MKIEIDYLPEPTLQFGQYFEHEDTKTGLAEYGPFGKNIAGLHPPAIRLGFIGTRATIEGAMEWVEECGGYIESENIRLIRERQKKGDEPRLFDLDLDSPTVRRVLKILNRDFVGFSAQSAWQCEFQTNQRWQAVLQPAEIEQVLKIERKSERINALVDLLDGVLEGLAKTPPAPDVIILALTPEIEELADSVRIEGNFFLNFRRAIKARAMRWGIPIQLMRRGTILGKGEDIQEKSTRAWNFCTALYYKADGIPWRSISVEQDTCYVGVSFFVAGLCGTVTVRSSVAQAFDLLGQGLVVRGDPFEWDEDNLGRTPHLRTDDARSLIATTLKRYEQIRRVPPRRVVVHKASRFWGKEHDGFDELSGFRDGIAEVFPRCETDLVTLAQADIRFFREGKYPPARGTLLTLEDDLTLLYTAGYIPFMETYPGNYPPSPWQITEYHGGSSPKQLMRDVLELTKMNVNNCAYADGVPITLSFSRKIGEIMKHAEGKDVQTHYKFYM